MERAEFNVFISWSGERSKLVASALHNWIPLVIQTAKPFMSDTDIEKGSRGLADIASALNGVSLGITCLTPENLSAIWLFYEAGAISKAVDGTKTKLCTLLLGGLRPEDVKGPLGMFQATKPEKEDVRKLIHSINRAVGNPPLVENSLDRLFDGMWPQLDDKLKELPSNPGVPESKRPFEDMIAEILEIVRADHSRRKSVRLDGRVYAGLQRLPPVAADDNPKRQAGQLDARSNCCEQTTRD